jgi:hypothetical protein
VANLDVIAMVISLVTIVIGAVLFATYRLNKALDKNAH